MKPMLHKLIRAALVAVVIAVVTHAPALLAVVDVCRH